LASSFRAWARTARSALRAIKEKAGVVFVQEPTSAKFDGMPRSAVEAGLADVIAPVEELPRKLIAYLQHVPLAAKPGLAEQYSAQSALEKVVILLRAQTGHDFSLYKKSMLYRRIERRAACTSSARSLTMSASSSRTRRRWNCFSTSC